jgi:hypothetical protein
MYRIRTRYFPPPCSRIPDLATNLATKNNNFVFFCGRNWLIRTRVLQSKRRCTYVCIFDGTDTEFPDRKVVHIMQKVEPYFIPLWPSSKSKSMIAPYARWPAGENTSNSSYGIRSPLKDHTRIIGFILSDLRSFEDISP